MKSQYIKKLVLASAALIAFVLLTAPSLVSSVGGAGAERQSSSGVMSIIYSIVEFLVNIVFMFVKPLMGMIEESLLSNPEIYPMRASDGQLTMNGRIFRNVFIILAPIYATALLILGAYMVFMSHSPRGRAQAKMMIDKLVVSMVVVPVSPAIYEILLQTSNIVTRSVLSIILAETGKTTIGDAFMSSMGIATTPLWLVFVFNAAAGGFLVFWIGVVLLYTLWMALIIMWFRYLTVKLFAFLFPIVLFMYLFDWTRHIGAMLLKYTLVWIFTPVISAVFLTVGILLVFSSPASVSSGGGARGVAAGAVSHLISAILNPMFLTVTLMLTWVAPLVMSGLMRVLGGIVSAVGMIVPGPYGMVLSAAGGVMQGKSPAEFATVGLKYAGAKSLKSLKGAMMGKKGASQQFSGATGGKKITSQPTAQAGSQQAAKPGGTPAQAGSQQAAAKPGAGGGTGPAPAGADGQSKGGLGGAGQDAKAASGGSGGDGGKQTLGQRVKSAPVRAVKGFFDNPLGRTVGKLAGRTEFAKGYRASRGEKDEKTGKYKSGRGASMAAGAKASVVGAAKGSLPWRLKSGGAALPQALRDRKAGIAAAKDRGKGKPASQWAGLKEGVGGMRSTMDGAGQEKVNADQKRESGKGGFSRDVNKLGRNGVINGEQAAGLQSAGLTSNAAITKADDKKLQDALGGGEEKAEEVRAAASKGMQDERQLKESLGAPSYSQKERDLDLMDNSEQDSGEEG